MASMAAGALTYTDLEHIPEEEGTKQELIDGVLYVVTRPLLRHQRVIGELFRVLADWGEAHAAVVYVEPGVFFDERNYVSPDLVMVTAEHNAASDPRHVDVPLLLAVEVSSPSTRRHDLVRKRRLYERRGVAEYWFVDLDADRIEAYRLVEGVLTEPLLAGRGQAVASPGLAGSSVPVDRVLGSAGDPGGP
jgi:Uma2 family endonuclease